MNSSRTLWMGNIEKWMDEEYIKSVLATLDIFPTQLSILSKENQRNCCFIELETPQDAQYILDNYNGKKMEDFTLKFNWVNVKQNNKKNFNESNAMNNNKKYSIYVGNLDKDIATEELKNFFQAEFPSVTFAKIIHDPSTKVSRGFGFVDFSSFEEYQQVLNTSAKTKRLLRNKVLTINPAKAKKDELISLNNFVPFIPANFLNNHSKEYYPQKSKNERTSKSNFTSSSCPELLNIIEFKNENFALSLQKGFKDIVNMYKASFESPKSRGSKPQLSLQCNYYCNLSTEIITPRGKREFEEFYEEEETDDYYDNKQEILMNN